MQLEKCGQGRPKIIVENCQFVMYCGFAPMSEDADNVSKRLGNKTVLSGSVSQGRNASQTMQMIERPLMTGDELHTMPKGSMLVTKTGAHPIITQMKLYTQWGITFGEPYTLQDKSARPVKYVSEQDIVSAIISVSKRDVKKIIFPTSPQFNAEVSAEAKAPAQSPAKALQNAFQSQHNSPLRTD